jgi:hypothetical protein
MGPICCAETSVAYYHFNLHNILEEHRSDPVDECVESYYENNCASGDHIELDLLQFPTITNINMAAVRSSNVNTTLDVRSCNFMCIKKEKRI